jgi:hypothetical protein
MGDKYQYKRSGLPFFGEGIINWTLKLVFGIAIFLGLYYMIFLSYNTYIPFLTQMSYIMLFSLIATITAMLISYVIIWGMTKWLKLPKKGWFDLNHIPTVRDLTYEFLAVVLDAVVMASGLYVFLSGAMGATWEQFVLLYCVVKLMTRLIASTLSYFLYKNWIFTVSFMVVFFIMLSISILQIVEVGLP